VLIFACYFTIGLQLAVVPGFVHLQLGYHAVVVGFAISAQYVATLSSRPIAGRMGDSVGAKRTTCSGLLVCATSGLVLWLSASLKGYPLARLGVLLLSRTLYLKRVEPNNTANVLSSAFSPNVIAWRWRRPIRTSRNARRTQ
jgi:MFS family permease